MKTITVRLSQEPQAGLFRVVSFSNTAQLSIGQIVPHKTVEDWTTRPHVNIHVLGMTPQVENEMPALDDARTDALALAGNKILVGGPGHE